MIGKRKIASVLVTVAVGTLVHTMVPLVSETPEPTPVPTESTECQDGYQMAEDHTCVPDNYWDTPAEPDISTPEYPAWDIGILPACPEEDSDNCYWDAATRGNGTGTSFITIDGTTYYKG